jgi:8-oxo-dGTP pyrophosphatase MutT (NUDIX family)
LVKLRLLRISMLPGGLRFALVFRWLASGGGCGVRGTKVPLVAVYVGRDLLLVRSSYRVEWNFPGGSVRRGETPDAAARGELTEEIGLTACRLIPAGDACGTWDGRRDGVHFFELRLDRLPKLQLDNREIIGARLVSPENLNAMRVTGPVAVYLSRTPATGRQGATIGHPTNSR